MIETEPNKRSLLQSIIRKFIYVLIAIVLFLAAVVIYTMQPKEGWIKQTDELV
jgi:uncharacterized protein involved in exopolysaccharide biosynthesis